MASLRNAELTSSSEKGERLRNKIADLETEVESKDSTIRQLKEDAQDQSELSLSEARAKISTLRQQLDRWDEWQLSLDGEMQSRDSEFETYQRSTDAAMADLEDERLQMQTAAEESEARVRELEEEVATIREKLAAEKDEGKKFSRKAAEQIRTHQQTAIGLNQELVGLRASSAKETRELRAANETLRASNESLKGEVNQLSCELVAQDAEQEELEAARNRANEDFLAAQTRAKEKTLAEQTRRNEAVAAGGLA